MPLWRLDEGDGLIPALIGVQRQSVLRYANAAARAAQLSTPAVGDLTFLIDVKRFDWWDGAAWIGLGADAALAARVTALEGRMTAAEGATTALATRMTSAEGRIAALEGRAAPVWAGGFATVSTDGVALATIAHGLPAAPRTVVATLTNQVSPVNGSQVNDWAIIHAITATSFTVRIGDSGGSQYVNRTGIALYWLAFV
jgi:hypothetical protein